eukprot:XP_007127831.1 histone H2A-Bbd type 1-like [Physeter catodon]
MTSQSLSCHKGSSLINKRQGYGGQKDTLASRETQASGTIKLGRLGQNPANTVSWKRSFWHYRCRKKHSHSTRAELQFPVSCVDLLLQESCYAQRLSLSTPVFLTGILEYLTANILELASREPLNNHNMCITPEHVQRALDNNERLSRLFEPGAFFPAAVLPLPEEK